MSTSSLVSASDRQAGKKKKSKTRRINMLGTKINQWCPSARNRVDCPLMKACDLVLIAHLLEISICVHGKKNK